MALTETELELAILDELRDHTVLSLAAMGDEGPHAVSLMYAHERFDIFWLSDPETHHSRYLAANSRAAVTIAAQHEDFSSIRGLQMSGWAHRVSDPEQAAMAFELLTGRYPFLLRFGIGKLARHLGAADVYRFRPTRLTLIDNSRGFGFKQTLALQETYDDRY